MVEFFLSILGRYARIFIEWYVRNTMLLSSLVVGYGIILIIAKNNLLKVEKRLREKLGIQSFKEIAQRLREQPLDDSEIAFLKSGLFLPIISSPNHVFFRIISNTTLEHMFSNRAR